MEGIFKPRMSTEKFDLWGLIFYHISGENMHLLASKYIAPFNTPNARLLYVDPLCPAIRIFYCMDVRYELYIDATIIKGNKILDIPDVRVSSGSHIYMALGLYKPTYMLLKSLSTFLFHQFPCILRHFLLSYLIFFFLHHFIILSLVGS